MAWLRVTVDSFCNALREEPLSPARAERLLADTRRAILRRFPTKSETYERIYAPRFARIFRERFGRDPREKVLRL